MKTLRARQCLLWLLAALLLLLALAQAAAAETPSTLVERAGASSKLPPAVPSRLNDISPAGLDAFILSKMDCAHTPGLAACVIYDGDIVWAKGYGWANIDERRRVTADTAFMLASVSKTFIATAVMQQIEDGALDLGSDVDGYLPFAVSNPWHPSESITLFQLLTHTSSIRDCWLTLEANYNWNGDSDIPLRDFCDGYLTPGGAYYNKADYYPYAPGWRWNYANMGATLAALVVEERTSAPFDDYCEAAIFGPLGMNRTAWKIADLDPSTVAMPYAYDDRTGTYTPYGHYGYPDYPDGQLRTSVSQLGRFLALFMNGGTYRGVKLLEPATVTQMLAPQPGVDSPWGEQGLIWLRTGGLVGHDGADRGVRTHMYFDPATGAGVVMLANALPEPRKGDHALSDILYRLLAEAPGF